MSRADVDGGTTMPGQTKPRVLVPWQENYDHAPQGLPVAVYDGSDESLPGDVDLSGVEFYVMPYSSPAGYDMVSRLPGLRLLQVLSAGYDHALRVLPEGVQLHSGSGLHDASAAELAVALILAAQRDLPRWVRQQQNRLWEREYTRSLAGSNVLIVGYGNIGRAVEERLTPFETTITRIAHHADADEDIHSVDDLHRLLPEADIVLLTLPLNDQTRRLFGAEEFTLMKDGALIVNIGRGPVLDTAALVDQAGRIRAALDVVDPEPLPPDHPLWAVPGVFITPHVAGGSATFYPRARHFVDEQVRRFAAGNPLANPVSLPHA